MKRSELVFNVVSIPVDAVSVLLAGIVSFYLRLDIGKYLPIQFIPNLSQFLHVLVFVVPVMVLLFGWFGLYNLKGTRKFSIELSKIISAVAIALLVVILAFFFNQSLFPSRFIVLVFGGLAILFVTLGRFLLRSFQIYLLNKGLGLHSVAILYGTEKEIPLVQEIEKNRELGYKVSAKIPHSSEALYILENLYGENKLEEIFQTDPNASAESNLALVQFARNKGLEFNFVPNLFEVQRNAIQIETIEGVPVITLKNTPLDGWGRVVKRMFDVVVSILCIILSSPFFLIIAIAIKLDSKGKILYTAPRAGLGKDFDFYKFRTMYAHMSVGKDFGGEEAEKIRQDLWKQNARGGEAGAFLKIKNDPRVTRIGKFLRKTKLDEIPQFFNVLKGDMSMVGPRAHVIDEVERYKNKYRRMFTIKPGIFGLSQIAQMSWDDLPFEEEIRLNTYYIENWSLWLDIVTLAKTFWKLFISRPKKGDYY